MSFCDHGCSEQLPCAFLVPRAKEVVSGPLGLDGFLLRAQFYTGPSQLIREKT